MDSWTTTLRLMLLMAVIAVFSLIGRWVAEMLQGAASGALPML